MTPDEQRRLDIETMLSETVGETNKTKEQVDREFEKRIIADFPPAPNLQGSMPSDLHDTDVAIPSIVQDALDEAIQKGSFPLDPEFVLWMESKVAEHNGVDPECICAHPKICHEGKTWKYYPEVATRFTGFTYDPI